MQPTVIPITGSVDPALLAGLVTLATNLNAAATATEHAGKKTKEASEKAEAATDRWRQVADAFNEVHAAGMVVFRIVSRLVEKTGELVSEQEHLTDMSRRLGLDFDEAAASAGRFVDEVDVMNTAGQFAARGIHLTQTELNDLTRVAGRAAQTMGITVTQATEQLQEALVRGRERGLAPFGASLAEAARHGYTLREGLAALHTQAGQTEQATNNATTAGQALADTFEDGTRAVATWSSHMLGLPSLIGGVTQSIGGLVEQLNEVNRLETAQEARTAEGGARARALDAFRVAQRRSGELADSLGASRSAIAVENINGLTTAQIATLTQRVTALNARLGAVQQAGADDIAERSRDALRPAAGTVVNLDTRTNAVGNTFPTTLLHTEEEIRAASRGTVISVENDRRELVEVYRTAGREIDRQQAADAAAQRARERAEAAARRHAGERADGGASGAAAAALRDAQRQMATMIQDKQREFAENERLRVEELRHAVAQIAAASAEKGRENASNVIRGVFNRRAPDMSLWRTAGAENDNAVEQQTNDKFDAARRDGEAAARGEQGASMADQLADKERDRLDRLREAHESYAGRLAELYGTQVNAAQSAAEFTGAAFTSMGKALASHVAAWAAGKESIGVALQGILADTLTAIGQESMVRGAFEIAQGVGALAGIVTAGLAPGHFAAGAAYLAVGALATAGGAALSPAPSVATGGAGGGAGGMLPDRASGEGGGGLTIVENNYAPRFGGREGGAAEVGQRMDRYTRAEARRTSRAA